MQASELRLILHVKDFDKSVHFYENLLGMQRITAWVHDTGPGIILKAGPGRTLELFGPPPGEEQTRQIGAGLNIGIQVDNVDEWHDRLQQTGVTIARGLVDNPWGDRSFGLDDPDGVRIWLNQVIDADYKASLT
jgi:catechol 2,3-dioxygenase-like lactoylglutathione lyase family enzyme